MAKNVFIRQWQKYITIVFGLACLTQTSLVLAQEKVDQPKTVETLKPIETVPNITIQTNEAITTDEAIINISNETQPKRVKPERSLYFLAQYKEQFDDNIMSRETNKAWDLLSIPQIGFGAIYVRPRGLFRIDYLGGVEIHQQFPDLNGVVQSLNAVYEYDLSKRTMLFANDNFYQSPLITGLTVFTNPNTNSNALFPLVPTRLLNNDFTIGIVRQLSKFSDLRASYSYSLSRFDNPKLINSDEHKVELNYTKRLSRQYSYDILYRGSFFLDQSSQITHTVITSLAYRYKDKLRLRFGLGPQVLLSDIDKRKLFLATLTELSYQANKTTYTLSFTTGIGKGGGLATVTRNKTLFATVEHSFNQQLKMHFSLGYSYARNGFKTALSPTLIDFTNNELIINSGLNYLIDNNLEVFFDYTHSNQHGTGIVVRDVSRNILSLGFRFDTRQKIPVPQKTNMSF